MNKKENELSQSKVRKKLYVIVGSFFTVLMVLFIVFVIWPKDEEGSRDDDNFLDKILPNFDACTNEKTTFTVPPIDLENLTSIVPLGNLNPSGHVFPTRHMYYGIRRQDPSDDFSSGLEVPLYAPIDATIENVNMMTQTNADSPTTDYSINFRTCEDFTFYFIHATSLSDKILDEVNFEENDCDEYSTGGRDYRNCWQDLDLKVEAGEVIGTVGGDGYTNFDFGVTDFRIEPHVYANPERWNHRDDTFYVTCSTDYYSGELKEKLDNLLGDFTGNLRTIEPKCGTIAQDVLGTAQGIWFLAGTTEVNKEDPHMALVHGNFDPTKGVFSMGLSAERLGITSGTYYFSPKESGYVNLDFDLVKPGEEVYCYEVGGSFQGQDEALSILVQLVDEETIRIGAYDSATCGAGPWVLGDFVEFER